MTAVPLSRVAACGMEFFHALYRRLTVQWQRLAFGGDGQIRWTSVDTVLSPELFRHYKPDREVYLGTADLPGCQSAELMMVAAHPADLNAACPSANSSQPQRACFTSRPPVLRGQQLYGLARGKVEIGNSGGYTSGRKESLYAQQRARSHAGYRDLTLRAVIPVLPRPPHLPAGWGRELGLHRARSTQSPSVYCPAESRDGRR